MSSSNPAPGPGCAICGRPIEAAYRPFCSKRCADVDLRRWLVGAYVVPGQDADADDKPASPPTGEED